MVQRSRRPSQSYRVFLSHANEDRWIAEVIREKLRDAGLEAWLDAFDLPGGAPLGERLREEMRNSDECFVLFSPASRGSAWVAHEVGLAHAFNKWTTVVLLHTTPQELPEPWRDLKHLSINDLPAYLRQVSARASGCEADDACWGTQMQQGTFVMNTCRARRN